MGGSSYSSFDNSLRFQSWRKIVPVYPGADILPMMTYDELLKLGEDIRKNGLRDPVMIYQDPDFPARRWLLDGRNRMTAMEMFDLIDPRWPSKGNSLPKYGFVHENPEEFVVSKNIYRRHLTKKQQADLIVEIFQVGADFANMARSVQGSDGRLKGSAKDPVKERAIREGKVHGVSKRTIERAIAKKRGPKLPPRKQSAIAPPKEEPPARHLKLVAASNATARERSKKALAESDDQKFPVAIDRLEAEEAVIVPDTELNALLLELSDQIAEARSIVNGVRTGLRQLAPESLQDLDKVKARDACLLELETIVAKLDGLRTLSAFGGFFFLE